MTENQAPDYSSFEQYQFGALAGIFADSEDSKRYAPSALEVLAGSKGLDLGEEAEGFIRGTQASEEGIATAINIYGGRFEEKRGKYSPSALAGWYSDVLSGLSDNETARIVGYLGKYDEPLGGIRDKVARASYIVKGEKTGANSPEEIAIAKKTLEKYGKVIHVINVLDIYKFESLRPAVIATTKKKDLKELAAQLPEVETKARGAA